MLKIIVRIKFLLETVVGAIFFVLVSLTIVQVFMRYAFNKPIMWADELMRLLLIWGTLLGAGLAIYNSKHISLDFITEKLPKNLQNILNILVWILIVGLSIFYIFKGTVIAIGSKSTTLPALNISKFYYYSSIPTSALFWTIFSVQKIMEELGVCCKIEIGGNP